MQKAITFLEQLINEAPLSADNREKYTNCLLQLVNLINQQSEKINELKNESETKESD